MYIALYIQSRELAHKPAWLRGRAAFSCTQIVCPPLLPTHTIGNSSQLYFIQNVHITVHPICMCLCILLQHAVAQVNAHLIQCKTVNAISHQPMWRRRISWLLTQIVAIRVVSGNVGLHTQLYIYIYVYSPTLKRIYNKKIFSLYKTFQAVNTALIFLT